ncbi:hypothetical protein ACHAXM_001120 [Skeletonema potamos]
MGITGIIRPPPDIRAVADRTALFVSKNGRAFENKILNSEKGKTPKFAFLHETSPFHAYYENRIRFYEEGGTDEEEKKKEEDEKMMLKKKEEEERERLVMKEKEEAAKKREAAKKASAVDPVARALLACRTKISDARRVDATKTEKDPTGDEEQSSLPSNNRPQAPPHLRHVSVVAPANLTPLELEVIKLTAQYVALAGKNDHFLRDLTMREWNNPEFTFLQPRHAHFAYFTALVDGYKSFLPGGDDYEKAHNKLRMDARKEQLSHMITGDEKTDLVSETDTTAQCLEAAAYRSEYERDAADRRREAAERAEGGGMLGGADTIDWHDFVVVETIDFPSNEVVEALPPPTSMRLAILKNEQPSKVQPDEDKVEEKQEEAMDESSEEEDDDGGEQLKVVANYQPKVVSTKDITSDSSRTHIVDPISGKQIAIADMPEHMRIQLLDPKWAEERRRFLDKQRETNFVAGEDIASNISRLAQAREDIFGSSSQNALDQKADSERRLMEANRIIREHAIQPQPQYEATMPPVMPAVPPPPMASVPPPPPPPMLMASVPPPPPPPPSISQHSVGLDTISEPAAKRPKLDEPQVNQHQMGSIPMDHSMDAGMTAAVPPPPEENQILSESDFIATLGNPDDVPICIQVPHDTSNADWNFNGQIVDVSLAASAKVKTLKEALKPQLGNMPINKMQLKHPSAGFLKDTFSLAHYNIGPMTTLELVPKTRGGRK